MTRVERDRQMNMVERGRISFRAGSGVRVSWQVQNLFRGAVGNSLREHEAREDLEVREGKVSVGLGSRAQGLGVSGFGAEKERSLVGGGSSIPKHRDKT